MKNANKGFIKSMIIILTLSIQVVHSQHVEVQGELRVTQMASDDTQENLVIRSPDGSLGTRSVASLPPPPPPIDTTRNLASDFELAKHLCDCPNLPPFMIKKLLESGYTQEELINSGVPALDVVDAQRGGILIDSRDNKSYKTVTIGTQTWMAENLNFGTRVDGATDQSDDNIIEKYCFDDTLANCTTYGGLYQWNEMMQYDTIPGAQGICPTGWHLPTDGELKTLEIELGMTQAVANYPGYRGTNEASQMADIESLWLDGTINENGAFGSSGFEALGAGIRKNTGVFIYEKFKNIIWSSTENGTSAQSRELVGSKTQIGRFLDSKLFGYSVRCVQD